MKHIIFHTVFYYIAWFGCLLSAAYDYYWLGIMIALIILMPQYYWQYKKRETKNLWIFIITLTLFGFIIDSCFLQLNLITFNANPFSFQLSPPWMIGIWLNFSVVLYGCLKKYFKNYWLFFILSLIGFPVAYLAGVKLGAATLPSGMTGLLIISITLAILLPLITYSYEKLLWNDNHA